jgi:NAD(P)-dependent dehydrogenase (short-subunit alcohol dehydrogenase family)
LRSSAGTADRKIGRMSDEFSDQIVIVTGAASGIGLTVAAYFADRGARIVGVDRSEDIAAAMAALPGRPGESGPAGKSGPAGESGPSGESSQSGESSESNEPGVIDAQGANSGGHLGIIADLTVEGAADRIVEQVVAEVGVPTILVNSAGVALLDPAVDLSARAWI